MKITSSVVCRLKRYALCLLTCAATYSGVVQAQGRPPQPTPAQVAQDREDRGPEPIVDIDKTQPDSASASVRRERGRRHNANSGHQLQEPAIGEEEETIFSLQQERLSALPVSQSDLILIADVVKASAFLSEAKDLVYSEFQLRITQIFMNNTSSLQNGDTLVAERGGGAVRFPSGRIWRLRTFDQGMPRVGGRYLFFLKAMPSTANYSLVTGYLLQNGKVQPLDGVGFHHSAAATLPGIKYKDSLETAILSDVKKAIQTGGAQ